MQGDCMVANDGGTPHAGNVGPECLRIGNVTADFGMGGQNILLQIHLECVLFLNVIGWRQEFQIFCRTNDWSYPAYGARATHVVKLVFNSCETDVYDCIICVNHAFSQIHQSMYKTYLKIKFLHWCMFTFGSENVCQPMLLCPCFKSFKF